MTGPGDRSPSTGSSEGSSDSGGDAQGGSGGPAARRRGAAYQGAFEAVASILVATGAGYWADQRFETSPWFLVVGAALGFGAFALRLLRLRPLLEEPVSDEKREK